MTEDNRKDIVKLLTEGLTLCEVREKGEGD